MDVGDAAALLAPAILHRGGTWADLGAGAGTFTRALASLLGESGRIYAVERDPGALAKLHALAEQAGGTFAELVPLDADFTLPLQLPWLDGALLANSLHFVSAIEQAALVARIARVIRPGGQIVIVEYENRAPSRWVPYPVSLARLAEIARAVGLGAPVTLSTRASAFGGTLYAATMAVSSDQRRSPTVTGSRM